MLYTVRPLEKIYAIPKTKRDIEKEEAKRAEKTEYQEVDLPNGRILTRRDGENNIICRVNSTDMSDYLNRDYSPGKAYNKVEDKEMNGK